MSDANTVVKEIRGPCNKQAPAKTCPFSVIDEFGRLTFPDQIFPRRVHSAARAVCRQSSRGYPFYGGVS